MKTKESTIHVLRKGKDTQYSDKWDLSGFIPIPAFEMTCKTCGAKNSLILRRMRVHDAPWSPSKYRMNFYGKCGDTDQEEGCGVLSMFGIIITEEIFNRFDPNRVYTRNEVIEMWENYHG